MYLKLLVLFLLAVHATVRYSKKNEEQVYLVLHDCGCWKDSPHDRAIPDADHHLDGYYKTREDAVQECGKYAKSKGYELFGVQDGGRCKTGPTAMEDFRKYGPSYSCSANKKGGYMANQIYRINLDYELNYREVGCCMDSLYHPAIPSVEKRFNKLHDDHKERYRAIRTCGEAALGLGYKIFALQDGGKCMTGPDAGKTYHKYGKSYECKENGRGGYMANMVYEITEANGISVTGSGCYSHIPGSVPSLEGKGILDPSSRDDTIEQCLRFAASLGYRTIGIVDGRCHSSEKALEVYKESGSSDSCRKDGKGGPYAAQVYHMEVHRIVTVQYWGCWADDDSGTIPSVEGLSPTLSDDYKTRTKAVNKCAGYAYSKRFNTFALQDGGQCRTSAAPGKTYQNFRPAEDCGEDKKGGKMSNSVWMIIYNPHPTLAPGKPYVESHVLCSLL